MRRLIGLMVLILFPGMWVLNMLVSWLFRRRVDPIESLYGTWISWKVAYWY